jgi:putative transcriptional regulator
LIGSAKEALVIAQGEAKPARAFSPAAPDVAAIRKRLGLSQDRFAKKFGLSPRPCAIGNRGADNPTRRLAIFCASSTTRPRLSNARLREPKRGKVS